MTNVKKMLTKFSICVVLLSAFLVVGCEKNKLTKVNTNNQETISFEEITFEVSNLDNSEVENTQDTNEYVSDLDYFRSNDELEKYIKDVADIIEEYEKANPNATVNQLNKYAKHVLEQVASERNLLNGKTLDDLDNYLSWIINDQEYELLQQNISSGIKCLLSGQYAINVTNNDYAPECIHNHNGDAFRHIVWTYSMAEKVGNTFAKQWSDAHEYGSTDQPVYEMYMDLFNNDIGLNLALANSSFSLPNAKQKVTNGNAVILVNNTFYWSNGDEDCD